MPTADAGQALVEYPASGSCPPRASQAASDTWPLGAINSGSELLAALRDLWQFYSPGERWNGPSLLREGGEEGGRGLFNLI